MVTWTCDRCGQYATDNGVRYSNLPEDWGAVYLASVGHNETQTIHQVVHLCKHCASLPDPISVDLKK